MIRIPLSNPRVTRLAAAAALLLAAMLGAAAAAAQDVGYPPARSPYRDIDPGQRVTLFGGYFTPQKDEIGATPRAGPMLGAQYEITVGGPAQFTVRGAYVDSRRTAFDPALPAASRSLGAVKQPLYIADLGFSVNLTGQKSWRSLIPTAAIALGVVSGPRTTAKDPYALGTQFAISTMLGLRIVPEGSYELRLGAGSTLYQNRYPAAYFTDPSATGTPLLGRSVAKSGYRNAWSATAGVAVPIFR